MTRPTNIGEIFPQQFLLGGDPSAPEGSTPPPDCCSVDQADQPDRASGAEGARAVSLSEIDSTPPSSDLTPSGTVTGYTTNGTYNPQDVGNVKDGNPSTWAYFDNNAYGGSVTAGLVCDLGAPAEVTSMYMDDRNSATCGQGIPAVAVIEGSANGSSWTTIAVTRTTGTSPVGAYQRVTYTFDNPETYRYWRWSYNTGTGFQCGWTIRVWAINGGILDVEYAWNHPEPDAIDGDDATCTRITGAEVLQVDLGAEFRIASTRLRIACQTAGAKTYSILAGNLPDLSDAVTVATLTFTGTGSYTAQDVEATWYTEDSYRFFQLNGNAETRDICSWELREPTLATNHQHDASGTVYDNDASGLTADTVQEALDELAGSIGSGSDAPPPLTARYVFDTTTTDADPGSGKVRLSNASQSAAVTIRADLVDANGVTVTNVLDAIAAGLGTVKAYARLQHASDPTKWLVGTVSAIASPSGYRNITWANLAASTSSPFANGDEVYLTIAVTTTAHQASHNSGGGDAIKLDDLATPDDNTDLNVSTTRHGLAPKLPNDATKYLDGTGAYTTPAGGGGGGSSGGGAMETVTTTLAADVGMSGSFADVMSVSLGIGTWLVLAQCQGESTSGAGNLAVKLTDGTTVFDATEVSLASGYSAVITMSAKIVLAAAATIKVQGKSNAGTLKVAKTGVTAGGNVASTITAVKLVGAGGIDLDVSPVPTANDDEFKTTDTSDPMTGWTTIGAPTAHDINSTALSHYYVKRNSAGGSPSWSGIYKAVPAFPFTVTVKLSDSRNQSNYASQGLFIGTATPGAMEAMCFGYDSGPDRLGVFNYSNPTTYNATVTASFDTNGPPMYMRAVVASSTSVTWQYSLNGLAWRTLVTTRNPGFTIGSIGLAASGNAADGWALFDWVRFGDNVVWPDAKAWQNLGSMVVTEDPVRDALGAPDTAFEFDTTSLTGLTALSNAATTVDANTTVPGAYYIKAPAAGCAGHYAAIPAAYPWTAICKLSDYNARGNYNEAGMFVGVATPGSMRTLGIGYGSLQGIQCEQWTTPTSYSSSPATFSRDAGEVPLWLAIRAASNTNIDFLASYNGRVWFQMATAVNLGITVGSVGIFGKSDGGALSAAFDWFRIWNSSKTLPGG